MKLNFTKEEIDNPLFSIGYADMGDEGIRNFIKDWLAMHAELETRAELIQRLDDALHNIIPATSAIEVLEKWRTK